MEEKYHFFPKSVLIPFRAPPATTDVSPAFVKSLFPVNNPNPVAAAPPASTVPPTLKFYKIKKIHLNTKRLVKIENILL